MLPLEMRVGSVTQMHGFCMRPESNVIGLRTLFLTFSIALTKHGNTRLRVGSRGRDLMSSISQPRALMPSSKVVVHNSKDF